ncbi:MAG: type II secretion system minor pseudopilin GspH [Pseudomonadales bacterium]|nr:type II secretion system minor pseudopilin GspH [Pseudomonadales bacterium]
MKALMLTCAIPTSSRHSTRPAWFWRAPDLLGQSAGRDAGFTLVEILVVLFIVAIMSGVVVANLPSFAQSGDFDTETRRLKTLLELARLESQVQADELGFNPSEEGYEFLVYSELDQSWQVNKEKPFTRRELPPAFRLAVRIEDSDLALSPPAAADSGSIAARSKRPPPILILSSGEITPFEITLTGKDKQTRTLLTDGVGDLHWQGESSTGTADAP